MEDFEYSVEICDRDWECFFAECEECDMLPPSLAGVDDSGMSDMDDAGSILAKRAQRVDPAACFSVTERPVDAPPDCEGSPVERYLGRHGAGGLEGVLSGSEEDIHLQSVNLFFEGLKGLAEDERPSEPGKSREEEEEEEDEEGRWRGDGQRASGNTLPKNIPELNCLPAKGETAVGNETMEPAGTMRHTNTVRKDPRETKSPNESASETSERAKVLITGSMNGTTQHNQLDSEVETFPGKGGLETSDKDLTRNPDVKWKENQTPPQPAPASQAWSPASVKKRRRKKRRLCEGGQLPARQSDTDEERYPSPGSLCSPEDAASFHANELQKNVAGSTPRAAAGADETTDCGLATAPRQSDYNNIRATSSSADGGKPGEECDRWSVSVPGKSDQIRGSLRKEVEASALHPVNQHQPHGKSHSAEVRSVSPAHAPAVGSGQDDRRSATNSAVAAKAGNSGEDERTPRQTAAEPQQQLEGHCRNTDQDGGAVAPHLPHAELKTRERPSLHETSQEVSSPLSDGSCEAGLRTGGGPKSEETRVKPSDSQVNVALAKSYREDLLTSASDAANVSSACSLESVTSLSNATDLSASFSSSLSEGKSILDQEEAEQPCDSPGGADETTASQPEKDRNSVFAISSFWSEMERLTINDILGLRVMSRAPPAGCLPPLREVEEADTLDGTNREPGCVESSSPDSSSPKSVTWEREPVLPSLVTEDPPAVFPARPRQGLRKISKNVSVHNLHALESQTFDGAADEAERFEDSLSNRDEVVTSSPPSLADSYSFSLTDMFQFLFRGKQSLPDRSAPENPVYTCGNSVPESYDHFFSEFDTESFFYPHMTAEDRAVPIFSCARSASRNLQFPDAYDYFFKSSSSDDSSSSSSSDEEDGGGSGPVRVVTRFSRKASSSQLSTDVYEDFFTDREDFFWKTTFSFRNVHFPASTVPTQRSNPASLVPVRESRTSYPRALHHFDVLGNQDGRFPDPLLGRLEERISRQLIRRPFTHEDVQTVVSNPRLDAPFLPLKQSDMCMVCIAFASWVLKTANPQVGDAWKAVLLANVSALSAIRYLRKYVRVEAATSETEPPES